MQTRQLSVPNIAVYADTGAWMDGVIAFEHFLDWKGVAHERVTRDTINKSDLRGRFTAIYFPGGYAGDYTTAITAVGARHIKDFVNDGGGYIGICAGAYYAARTIEWEGQTFPGELDLFEGTASGALSVIRAWPGYCMTSISLNGFNPITRYQRSKLTTMYFGGPSFRPDAGKTMDTIATWDLAGNTPAIITVTYGNGRVLLVGPHPEIEENSTRDGSVFGSEYSDPESDWGLLWSAMDWLLGRPISDSTGATTVHTTIAREGTIVLEQNYPNPFSGRTIIRYRLPLEMNREDAPGSSIRRFDPLGRQVAMHPAHQPDGEFHSIIWDARDVPGGAYRVVLAAGNMVQTKTMFVLR